MLTFNLPIYWTQHYKTKPDKTVLASMNWYRNANYYAQNNMKKDFHALVDSQLSGETIKNAYTLNMEIYYKNPSCDGANIAPLVEKFVLDALQAANVVVNDNVNYHKGSTWKIVEQDKNNPRCLVTVVPIKLNSGDQ